MALQQQQQQQQQEGSSTSSPSPSSSSSSNTISPNLLLEGSSSTYQAWSRSYVEMYTIAHEWTIDNFIELDEEAQVTFKVTIEGNEELRFKLSLKPKYGENRDYISLYVHNLNKKDLKYSLVFNILSGKEKKLTRRADTRVHAPSESWGFPKFCQRSDVLDCAAEMLPEGTMTVLCEIGGFKRITNRSDYQRVRERFNSKTYPDLTQDLTDSHECTPMAHTDMALLVGEERFPCHKFMLSARSDVFRAMFVHDMKESRKNEVELEETTSHEVVRQFLKFIYTDSFDDRSFRTVSQLLPLAEKYNVKRLSVMCGQSLLQSMTEENVSEIAIIGHVYGVSLLKGKAIEYISQYPERVMKTAGWNDLLKQAPDVCTAIICRLSRVGCDKEVVVRSNTKSGGGGTGGGGNA